MNKEKNMKLTKNELLVLLLAIVNFVIFAACVKMTHVSQVPVVQNSDYSVAEDLTVVLNLDAVSRLGKIGQPVTIKDDRLPGDVIIVLEEKGKYVAASDLSAHCEKVLSYNGINKHFICSSPGPSEFDLTGKVISGPAEKPLKIYDIFVKDGNLIFSMK